MKTLRISLAALACWCAALSHASSITTDYTDLWFIPAESGWGANVIQQGDTLFVTLFVYGTNNQPTWYSASAVVLTGSSGTSVNFSGPLYQSSGPYFGGPFSSANVTTRPVGTLTFNATTVGNATLTYSVDNVTVQKAVVRDTWRAENIAGVYFGSTLGSWSNCGARNGYVESPAVLTLTHDPSSQTVSIREEGSNYTCTYNGLYGQQGRQGSITGQGLCSDGVNATFAASEVAVSLQALTMKFNTNQINGNCTFVGRMGGLRRGS